MLQTSWTTSTEYLIFEMTARLVTQLTGETLTRASPQIFSIPTLGPQTLTTMVSVNLRILLWLLGTSMLITSNLPQAGPNPTQAAIAPTFVS